MSLEKYLEPDGEIPLISSGRRFYVFPQGKKSVSVLHSAPFGFTERNILELLGAEAVKVEVYQTAGELHYFLPRRRLDDGIVAFPPFAVRKEYTTDEKLREAVYDLRAGKIKLEEFIHQPFAVPFNSPFNLPNQFSLEGLEQGDKATGNSRILKTASYRIVADGNAYATISITCEYSPQHDFLSKLSIEYWLGTEKKRPHQLQGKEAQTGSFILLRHRPGEELMVDRYVNPPPDDDGTQPRAIEVDRNTATLADEDGTPIPLEQVLDNFFALVRKPDAKGEIALLRFVR